MKLTNVSFLRPIFLDGMTLEGVTAAQGYVEELPTFPWCRVVITGKKPRRTTLFNVASCDDWADEPEAKGKK